jgi:hypothetical protein
VGLTWQPESCGNCGRRLLMHDEGPDGRYPRRHVPRKGGRRLVVCGECAGTIDEQQQLDVDDGAAA